MLIYLKRIVLLFMLGCQLITFNLSAQEKQKNENTNEDISKPVAILEPLDTIRVHQIESLLVDIPFGLGKPYTDRTEWERIATIIKYQEFIKNINLLKADDFPKWSDDIYLEYKTKGIRKNTDKMMRDRSEWLGKLVLAECLENKGRFIPLIEFVLKELLHQRSWSLAAHDKNYKNFYGKEYEVDLSAASLATLFSQTYYLLGDKLTENTRKDIRQSLQQRVFDPILSTFKTMKNHWWLTTTNNWNSVCLAGVTGAALTILPNKSERAAFVAIAEKYSQNYIASYTDDGYCTEGLGYYNYGFGRYITLREFLLASTNNQLDLFKSEKMIKIAQYPINLEIINQCYPTISDCRVGTKADAPILWYCNNALGLGLKQYAVTSVPNPNDLVFDIIKLKNNVYKANLNEKKEDNQNTLRSYFDNTGVLICRPKNPSTKGAIGVALKGGNNNEHHNHNAIGSYTIVIGKEVMMGDPGGPFVYNNKTFSNQRYTLFKSLASFGHPVPLVASVEQKEGASSQAKVLKTDFSSEQDLFVLDITSAYQLNTLKKLERSFLYKRTDMGSLEVTDNFSFSTPQIFETALTTRAKWKQINESQLTFETGGEKMMATIKAPCPFKITVTTITEDQPSFDRIGIKLANPLKEGTLIVTFRSEQ